MFGTIMMKDSDGIKNNIRIYIYHLASPLSFLPCDFLLFSTSNVDLVQYLSLTVMTSRISIVLFLLFMESIVVSSIKRERIDIVNCFHDVIHD